MNKTATIFFMLFLAGPALSQQKPDQKYEKLSFKVKQFINSHSVDFDRKGRCKSVDGILMREWRVPSFPAAIPHFETCISITSTTTKGLVDFELVVQDGRGHSITSVEGAIDLGDSGAASQAVDWDHLEIPRAGKYYMRLEVQGKRFGSYRMLFKKSRASR